MLPSSLQTNFCIEIFFSFLVIQVAPFFVTFCFNVSCEFTPLLNLCLFWFNAFFLAVHWGAAESVRKSQRGIETESAHSLQTTSAIVRSLFRPHGLFAFINIFACYAYKEHNDTAN